ncbi:MAG: hypothetical protein PF503_18680 [Desulfobacula sp.]|jgi:hypothetical protein|nr:hypothetical protein [Desulfobacula sp.]
MKVNSGHTPDKFTSSKGKLFYNFSIVESEKTDETGTRTSFDYESVEVKDKKKSTVIAAIMRDRYSIDEEFALVNNKFKNKDNADLEYDDYQAMRSMIKDIAKDL